MSGGLESIHLVLVVGIKDHLVVLQTGVAKVEVVISIVSDLVAVDEVADEGVGGVVLVGSPAVVCGIGMSVEVRVEGDAGEDLLVVENQVIIFIFINRPGHVIFINGIHVNAAHTGRKLIAAVLGHLAVSNGDVSVCAGLAETVVLDEGGSVKENEVKDVVAQPDGFVDFSCEDVDVPVEGELGVRASEFIGIFRFSCFVKRHESGQIVGDSTIYLVLPALLEIVVHRGLVPPVDGPDRR